MNASFLKSPVLNALLFCLGAAFPLFAETDTVQEATPPAGSDKRHLAPADYGKWERFQGQTLSRDGRWLMYTIVRVDEKKTLHLVDLEIEDREKAVVASFEQGERAVFSKDSQWLSVFIGKSPNDKPSGGGPRGPRGPRPGPPSGSDDQLLKLRRLTDGETTEIKNVTTVRFSEDSRYATLSLQVSAGEGKPPSKALLVRDLATSADTTFGNVVRHAWSDREALLAMVIDSPAISNALQIYDPQSGRLRVLDSSEEEYATLEWREDAMDLVVLREKAHKEKEDVSHVLLAWKGLDRSNGLHFEYDHEANEDFPDDVYVQGGGLQWSESGDVVYFDLKQWENRPEKEKSEKEEEDAKGKEEEDGEDKDAAVKPMRFAFDAEDKEKPEGEDKKRPKEGAEKGERQKKSPQRGDAPDGKGEPKPPKPLRETIEEDSNVEVWHAQDATVMPRQKKQATREKNPNRRAVWRLEEGKVVQLGNELTESIAVLRVDDRAIGRDATPHERTAMFGPRLSDVYMIDTRLGERDRVLEAVQYFLGPSPDGRFLLYVDNGHIWSLEVEGGKRRNLTESVDSHFTNQENDSLVKEKPPYGGPQWLKDSSAVWLVDRYDIWSFAPDGSSHQRLTKGAPERIRYRLDGETFLEEDDGLLDPKRPAYLQVYGDLTKQSGFAQLRFDRGTPRLSSLLWEDRAVHSLERAADNGHVWMFVRERFDDSPALFVGDADLADARLVAETNPFQKDYHWGHAELVDYVNDNGTPLQGALYYPAGYEEGKQYPMIVLIYEKLSQNLHRYPIPSELSPYNVRVFSAEGYFVFQPDIVYRPQEPGVSAVECIVPAVKEVLKKGVVDPDHVALMGHSWGGYQTAFTVTQTNLFAAGVAGAPLTDMMSMSVQVYWNTGGTNARIFHQSQGRMDTPFWRDVDNYVRNSPIHGMDKLKTPLLMTFGDEDGAVDWGQGVQMYNAARLAGKEDFVMLVYPGENHGLRKKENRVDYHYRVKEWLAHYLKGEEAPKWVTEGKSHLDRQKELEEKKKAKEKAKGKPPGAGAGRPPVKRPDEEPEAQKGPEEEAESKKQATPKEAGGKRADEEKAKKRKERREKRRAEREARKKAKEKEGADSPEGE